MEKQNNNDSFEPPITVYLTRIYESIHKIIRKFPKHEQYSLGEKLENAILSSIEISISANLATKYERERYLIKLGATIDLAKIISRCAFNLKFIGAENYREYLSLQKELVTAGKMAGGWIKFARNQS